MFSVSQTRSFEASHYIRNDGTPDYYRHVHGHSFVLTVECSSADVDEDGWVIDLGQLENALIEVTALLDHKVLNEIEGLEVPTFENIMRFVDREMVARGVTPSRIEIARPTLGQKGAYTPQR